MENLKEIENAPGLYRIQKMKFLYRLGYNENNCAYMINLDTRKTKVKYFNKEGEDKKNG